MTPAKIEEMTKNPRIDEHRRRVEKDPSSIAFAQLAEEYRRNRDYLQAVNVCRDGLARHPGYLSAQVTLGRALMELGQIAEARKELKAVLAVAPDNLAAIRAMADLHHLDEEPLEDVSPMTAAPAPAEPSVKAETPVKAEPPVETETRIQAVDPALRELEHWLTAIVADRAVSH